MNKINKNKYYRNKANKIVGPMRPSEASLFPWTDSNYGDLNAMFYKNTGQAFGNEHYDLTQEVIPLNEYNYSKTQLSQDVLKNLWNLLDSPILKVINEHGNLENAQIRYFTDQPMEQWLYVDDKDGFKLYSHQEVNDLYAI